MQILDNLKLATLPLTNFATGGSIGTAATTVDIISQFNINQTTAGQILTLATPTVTLAGDNVRINNVGSVSFVILGKTVNAGTFTDIFWNGTTYSTDADSGRNMGAPVVLATMTAGNNTVTHNLAMPTGSFSNVNLDVRDATGSPVSIRRITASDTTNAIIVNTPIAISTATTFYITPIA